MIAILGRGESLMRYVDFSHLYDEIYIVNNFTKEINLIGDVHFKNKCVNHIVGRGKNNLELSLYKKLGINFIQTNSFRLKDFVGISNFPIPIKPLNSSMRERGFPPLAWDIYLKYKDDFPNYKELIKFVENKHKKDIEERIRKKKSIRAWPTTGLLSIDFVLFLKNPKEIHLFGFDFYEKEYMIKDIGYKDRGLKPEMMKYYLQQLINEFNKTRFLYYGYCEKFEGSNFKKV